MAKAEISWKRTTPEGVKLQVTVLHTGGRFRFFSREQRFDRWEPVDHPPLEDWQHLLDAVQRRVQRRLLRPEQEDHVRQCIRERFPGAPP